MISPVPSCLCCSKFWTRNRPGDTLRDKYNLNTLPIGPDGEVIEGKTEIFTNYDESFNQGFR